MKFYIPVTLTKKTERDNDLAFAFIVEGGKCYGSIPDMHEDYLLKCLFINRYPFSFIETTVPKFFTL